MALISCPECKNKISDMVKKCPHCGLLSEFFEPVVQEKDAPKDIMPPEINIDYTKIGNVLISFDRDYCAHFSNEHYISSKEKECSKSCF